MQSSMVSIFSMSSLARMRVMATPISLCPFSCRSCLRDSGCGEDRLYHVGSDQVLDGDLDRAVALLCDVVLRVCGRAGRDVVGRHCLGDERIAYAIGRCCARAAFAV